LIDYLVGNARFDGKNGMVLDCGAIGVAMSCSSNCAARLAEAPSPVKVFTYLSATENGIFLYGFYDEFERLVFLELLSVSKVGAKTALGMLSTFEAHELCAHIGSSNVAMLSKAPGVGKKLAELIIINIKDKLSQWGSIPVGDIQAGSSAWRGVKADGLEALVSLGLDRRVSAELVEKAYIENMSIEDLVAGALARHGA